MKRELGFCVHGVMTSTLKEVPPDARAAILGFAFAKTFDISDYDLPKRFAAHRPIAVGIAIEAKRIIEAADNRPQAKSNAERQAAYRARKKASETNVTESNASNGVTLDSKIDSMTDRQSGISSHRPPTDDEIRAVAHNLGVPDDFRDHFAGEMRKLGWTAMRTNGSTYSVTAANVANVLRNWWSVEKKNLAARADGPSAVGGSGIRPTTGEEIWRDD